VIIDRIQREFLDDPDFRPKRVEKASFACKGLCEWVIKLKQYDEIVRYIRPKRQQLDEAESRYKSKMKELAVKQGELKAVVVQFEALQQKLQETSDHKQQLVEDINDC
jgi:dynein heavy chain